MYKGLAILSPACCATYLAVANFHSGLIETYNQTFQPVAPPGSFTDPGLPAGYAPFNIQQVGTQVFLTYAATSMLKVTPLASAQRNGRLNVMGALLGGAGLFGCFFAGAGRSRRRLHSLLLAGIASTLIAGSLLASTGCGGAASSGVANRVTASIVVTATSGSLRHNSTINLTVQ